jgi:Phytanoyl-CoA dioxygenase (PhyH)
MQAQAPVNLLPGVPLIDSPFFERIFPLSNPDAETVRIAGDLREKGFAVFDFPDPEIDRLCEEIKSRHAPGAEKLAAWRAGTLDLRNQDAWRDDANVKRVALNPTVLKILEKVYGRPAFAFQTLNFPVGSQQPPHSDSTHFSSSPEGFMCGVWLALEDIDADNGPLIYYPGSHRWPFYANEHLGVNGWHQPKRGAHAGEYQKLWNELIALRQAKPERFTAKKGQAIIWHARLMHGGDKQNDPARSRFSQVTHYYFRGCAYYTPLYSDPFYGNIFFRQLTDVATGEEVPNMVSGHEVPFWFLAQAVNHGPVGAVKFVLSQLKRRLLGEKR